MSRIALSTWARFLSARVVGLVPVYSLISVLGGCQPCNSVPKSAVTTLGILDGLSLVANSWRFGDIFFTHSTQASVPVRRGCASLPTRNVLGQPRKHLQTGGQHISLQLQKRTRSGCRRKSARRQDRRRVRQTELMNGSPHCGQRLSARGTRARVIKYE